MMNDAPLDHPRTLRSVDLLVGLLTLSAPWFLFGIGSDYRADSLVEQLWNLGHIGLYFVWTWYLTFRWTALMQMPLVLRLLVLGGLACGTGVFIEALQLLIGRSADEWDIARNLLGSCLALCWTSPHAPTLGSILRRSGRTVSFLALLLAVFPFSRALADRAFALHQFPMLADFELPWEIDRWSGEAQIERSSEVAFSGRRSLRVELGTTHYAGVSWRAFPRDWRHYEFFEINVYNPASSLPITFRIHDRLHERRGWLYQDRFNRRFILQPGWNAIAISLHDVQKAPQGRSMEMQNIMALGIFVVRLDRPRRVYLDNIRLRDRK